MASDNPIVLENQAMRLEFNPYNGALTGLTALRTGWKVLDRPHLGLSFRLLVPLSEERRNNPVYGEKQAVSAAQVGADGRSARFTWAEVDSEHGGRLAIEITLDVTLSEQQAVFTVQIANHSPYMVENVYCPYLGDVQHPPAPGAEPAPGAGTGGSTPHSVGAAQFKAFIYNYATAAEWPLWPHYQNMRGYYGVDYPTQFAPWSPGAGAPMSPFILLRDDRQGLYAGVCAPNYELVAWHTELRPGYGSSINARVPEERVIAGKDVATRFAAVHLPYIQPGETRALTPVALQPFEGGWQQGVDIYKAWRSQWMKLPPVPAWAREPHAWQQIHINSPEDELRIPFRDLVKVGEECARHGVKAIQLVGWNDGGQDQGNPSHSPDPRLGTFEELKDAIRQIQALGVRVVLFSKFTWADRATPRFRDDLIRLAIKDPYGDYYLHGGYQYQTATQLLDINTKRLIPMCFLSEEYLKVCDEEFKKTVELGADGILFDECLHHSPALLCFDPQHGHRYGAMVYANDNRLIENFHRITDPVRPDFLFAGEACYDWEMGVYHLSYHRSESKDHIPLSRYLLPEGHFMTAVTGFNDRSMINQCLLYRYIISYEPYNFKGRLDDFPLTVEYGRRMDALRAELREYFWDGEFRDKVGGSVTRTGRPHHPYAVYVSRQSGKAGMVIVNYDERETITVQAALDSGQALNRYRLVEDVEWKPTAPGIVIPPYSAAVVLE